MKSLGIYEVKAKISEICEKVKESREPVIITKRGIPMVKITPLEKKEKITDVWIKLQNFTEMNGEITDDLVLPERQIDPVKQPLDN